MKAWRVAFTGLLRAYDHCHFVAALALLLGVALWALLMPAWPVLAVSHSALVKNGMMLGDSDDHVAWFAQISDIHLRSWDDGHNTAKFRQFVNETLGVIDPFLTVLTGDVANSKDRHGSWRIAQHKDEWEQYRTILNESGLWGGHRWIDILGNHDVFAEGNFSANSTGNFHEYLSWSPSRYGPDGVGAHTLRTTHGSYRFLTLPTVKPPGTYTGYMGTVSSKELADLETKSAKVDADHIHTFVLGHHCTSALRRSGSFSPVRLNGSFVAYLCGHSHTKDMYALRKKGTHEYLELELASLAYQSIYRVVAIDNGLVSFKDQVLGEWPLIIPTNPKDSATMTNNEPLSLMLNSTYIRALIFSPAPISFSQVNIDGKTLCDSMPNIGRNMYACKWNPSLFKEGTHELEISAQDTEGRTAVEKIRFSLSGHRDRLGGMKGSFLLKFNLLQFSFWLAIALAILSFVITIPSVLIVLCCKDQWSSLKDKTLGLVRLYDVPYEFFKYHKSSKLRKGLIFLSYPILTFIERIASTPKLLLAIWFFAAIIPLALPVAVAKAPGIGVCSFMSLGLVFCPGTPEGVEPLLLVTLSVYYLLVFVPTLSTLPRQCHRWVGAREGSRPRLLSGPMEITMYILSIIGNIGLRLIPLLLYGPVACVTSPLGWLGLALTVIILFTPKFFPLRPLLADEDIGKSLINPTFYTQTESLQQPNTEWTQFL